MLKGRFGSLNQLRLLISDTKSAGHLCSWIQGCFIVQNLLSKEVGLEVVGNFLCEETTSEQTERTTDTASVQGLRCAQLFSHFGLENSN